MVRRSDWRGRVMLLSTLGAVAACAVDASRRSDAPRAETQKAAPTRATLHVLELKAFVYREPHRQAPPFVSLPLAAPVIVAGETTAGAQGVSYQRILEGPGAGGFVAEADLVAEPPTAPGSFERARSLLGEGKLDEAVSWGERAVALDARSREAWDLLAAIHDARQDVVHARPVYAARAKLAPLPTPPEDTPRWAAPAVGESRYIAATTLRVRESPSRTAKVMTELDLNTRVEVLGGEGEFTKVAWTSEKKDVWVVDLGGSADAQTQDAARREGYVGTAFLAPTPATREELLARADEAEPQGRLVEAARALERASLVAPKEGALLGRLTRVAAQARLYPLAAHAALKARVLTEGGQSRVSGSVTLDLYYGCRQTPPVDPAAACVEAVDTLGTCPLHPPSRVQDEVGYSGDESEEELEEENARIQANYREEDARRDAAQAKMARENAALRKKYPRGPWVHARVAGSRELHEKGQRVFVYALSFHIEDECDIGLSSAGYESIRFPTEPRVWPDEDALLEVWVTGGGYEQTLYGVVAAETQEEARALIREGLREHRPEDVRSPEKFAPSPNVVGPWLNCGGCAC